MMHTLIVDDEPLAREGLEAYVERLEFLHRIGSAKDALEALQILEKQRVDLLLLDIEMPQLSGLELLRTLSDPPIVILTTAFDKFALEGFKLAVLDYLVKPITFPRFLRACVRAREQFELQQAVQDRMARNQSDQPESIFVKSDGKLERIRFDELLFVESMQNYVLLQTERGRFTVLQPLKEIRTQLPSTPFLQVHRSFIVNLSKVHTVAGHQLIIGPHKIPVSRSNWADVEKALLK